MTPEKITRREFNKTAAAAVALPSLFSLPKSVAPDWRTTLEEKIRETLASPTMGEESKWDKQWLYFAPGPFLKGFQVSYGETFAQKTFQVDIGYVTDFTTIELLTNRVNRDEFCAAPPETLLLSGFRTERLLEGDVLATALWLTFTLCSRSHNDLWNPQGYWQRLTDADGCPVYPSADFNQIP